MYSFKIRPHVYKYSVQTPESMYRYEQLMMWDPEQARDPARAGAFGIDRKDCDET